VTAILATADPWFRHRASERLLEAGCSDLALAGVPEALADLLEEIDGRLVVLGGTWPEPRAFLRVAVDAGAPALVLFEGGSREADRDALAMGARAALQLDIPGSSLRAALAAVDAGLIVLDPVAHTNTHPKQPGEAPAATRTASGRPLTVREREILSLVATGTSNKGIARALSVSANTVKFHLAAVFEKLHASTRAEAVAEAIRRGELSLPATRAPHPARTPHSISG
jgi:DNA-binding NarL/FixJ family response regulator